MKEKTLLYSFKKAFLLFLCYAFICLSLGCNTTNNNSSDKGYNSGSMAGSNNDSSTSGNNAGKIGNALDDAGDTIGDMAEDAGKGIKNITNDLIK